MKKIYTAALVALTLSATPNTYAIGAVSRACQFSTIPTSLKALAAGFFIAVGAPLSTRTLPDASIAEQMKWWTFESLTTDYIETRYYLYASSDVYGYYLKDQGSAYTNTWSMARNYASPNWAANRISRSMQADSRFSIYYHNRGQLYSARAGNPNIVEFMDPNLYGGFVTVGSHTYYDPVSKITYAMKDTSAMDCNLPDFGLEGKGLFDW